MLEGYCIFMTTNPSYIYVLQKPFDGVMDLHASMPVWSEVS